MQAASLMQRLICTARYHNTTRPTSRKQRSESNVNGKGGRNSDALSNWKRVGVIAARAGSDDTSETEGEEGMTEEQREKHRRTKREAKAEREKIAKTMGLEYFLEMVRPVSVVLRGTAPVVRKSTPTIDRL